MLMSSRTLARKGRSHNELVVNDKVGNRDYVDVVVRARAKGMPQRTRSQRQVGVLGVVDVVVLVAIAHVLVSLFAPVVVVWARLVVVRCWRVLLRSLVAS